MADYLPSKETELDVWFLNFSTKIETSGDQHGFSGDELKRITDDYSVLHSLVQGSEAIRVNQSEYVAYKKIVFFGGANDSTPIFPAMITPTAPNVFGTIESGIVERIRAFVKRVKASPNYNESVGQDYQIISPTSDKFVAADAKPVIKIKAAANSLVEISFVKGESDGIELELQRGSETSWARVGNSSKPQPKTIRQQ